MTRTHQKHWRAYVDGYDLSGYERQIGALGAVYDFATETALTDAVKNGICGHGSITCAGLNGFLDNDTAGKFAGFQNASGTGAVMFTMGANAAPVAGNPVFTWKFEKTAYNVEPGTGFMAANLIFGESSYSAPLAYSKPWGVLIHPKGEETAVNSAAGLDDNGASSALGGVFAYQLFSSDGTVTLKMQDAATNTDGSFADLSGATSGSIDASAAPVANMVAIGATATVRRYLRWQVVFGTATEATFAIAFIRQ